MMRTLSLITTLLCFHLENALIPENDLKANVDFNLFTSLNTVSSQRIVIGNSLSLNFKATKPIIFIVHGFAASGNLDWIIQAKDKYLSSSSSGIDVNIITVNWAKYAVLLDYSEARNNIKDVGSYLAKFINFLVTDWGANINNVHCVGHSLGAHLCGYAGKAITQGKIGRITGLDPAGPKFSETIPTERLAPTDATFVDALHTAMNGPGFRPRVGHVDIYANGGKMIQPGCSIFELFVGGFCSHMRSVYYFIESIGKIPPKTPQFMATKCPDDWLNTGVTCTGAKTLVLEYISTTNTNGIFYLPTASKSPFALN